MRRLLYIEQNSSVPALLFLIIVTNDKHYAFHKCYFCFPPVSFNEDDDDDGREEEEEQEEGIET